jgi:hypothetical protein
MAKDDAGYHRKEIPAVLHLLFIQKRTLFTPFYPDFKLIQAKTAVFFALGADFYIDGKVFFPVPGYFAIPDSPEGGTIGREIQGFKKICLPLAVFPD